MDVENQGFRDDCFSRSVKMFVSRAVTKIVKDLFEKCKDICVCEVHYSQKYNRYVYNSIYRKVSCYTKLKEKNLVDSNSQFRRRDCELPL